MHLTQRLFTGRYHDGLFSLNFQENTKALGNRQRFSNLESRVLYIHSAALVKITVT